MIIIVEGIDRVGKTTLCNILSKKFNLPIYKHIGDFEYSRMDNDNETDKFLQILEICRLSETYIIFDRFHLTDYIYGVLGRNYSIDKALKNFVQIEEFLNKMSDGVILIFMQPTDLERSSKEHGSDLSKHNAMFFDLYKISKIKNKFQCSYNTMNEAIEYIQTVISKNI